MKPKTQIIKKKKGYEVWTQVNLKILGLFPRKTYMKIGIYYYDEIIEEYKFQFREDTLISLDKKVFEEITKGFTLIKQNKIK